MKKGQQLPRDANGKLRRKVVGEPWPCPVCKVEKPLTSEFWGPSATDTCGFQGRCLGCTIFGPSRPSCLAVNGMKHCNGLTHPEGGADLPVESFGPNRVTPDKLQGHCRACQAAYRKTPKGRASGLKGTRKWIAKHENREKSRKALGGHLKTGQSWTGQNRPVGERPKHECSTPVPRESARPRRPAGS